jgi:glycosyltransferase involved in cell wall biosynthesis
MARGSLRLLILAAQYFPAVGGSEVQTRLLARALNRRGLEVEVWTRRLDARDAPSELIDGVPVGRLGPLFRGRAAWLRRIERLGFVRSLYSQIRAEVRRFDGVLANQLQYPAVAAVLACRGTGVPVAARSAASGPESEMHRREWPFRLQRSILTRHLDRVVALGPMTRIDCEAAGFPASRIVIIPNALEIETTGDPARDALPALRVLWVGKLRREKRADLAIRAWIEAGIEGDLHLLGDGPEREAVEALTRSVRASTPRPAVQMMGLVDDPRPALNAAHVFLQSSDTEGLSNALLEAMAAGCACIATDVGETRFALGGEGLGEVRAGSFLEAEAGLLVGRDDAPGMAAALRALRNFELRQRLGRAAASRCRANHAIENAARRYEEMFRDLLKAGPPGSAS